MPRPALKNYMSMVAADWVTLNPTNRVDVLMFESDTGNYKVGDGSTAYTSLPYAPNNTQAQMTKGSGFAGTGLIYKTSVTDHGGIITTRFLIDVTGMNSSTAADIIGNNSLANCHFGQITAAVNGTILSGRMTCMEAPTTGEPDIDLYSATVSTGVEDAAISGISGTQILNTNTNWIINLTKSFGTIADNDYLYLVGSDAGTDNTYGGGKFIIELYGYDA